MLNRYTISIYESRDFACLKTDWEYLATGNDMTYFQTFQWYEMLLRFLPPPNAVYENVFMLIKEEGRPVLIAPFWIVKKTFRLINRKGCYFLGRDGWSDYLNFIYHEFFPDAVEFLFEFVEKEYGVHTYYLELLKESTESYQYLRRKFTIDKEYSRTCVKLCFNNLTEDEYWKSLSKSSRQNIRTAMNRCKKEDIQLNVISDDLNVVLEDCIGMREKRLIVKQRMKEHENKKSSFIIQLKRRIISLLGFKFPFYLAMAEDANSHYLSVYDNERLCAFFQYGVDERRHEIVIMSASVDEDYARYSPGILGIYSYVLEQIKRGYKIHTVDFTRGDEKYKYDVGGQSHFIHSIWFKYK